MKIKKTLRQNNNGFTLDEGKINCQYSLSKNNVELAYYGPVPEQFKGATTPRISFNVQAAHGAVVSLLADSDGKKIRAAIEAGETEIKDILMRFFYREDGKTRFDCGMDIYWLGVWAAHFMEWERARYHVWDVIERLTPSERAALLAELQRTSAEPATA